MTKNYKLNNSSEGEGANERPAVRMSFVMAIEHHNYHAV
jgi:hypothetical protein